MGNGINLTIAELEGLGEKMLLDQVRIFYFTKENNESSSKIPYQNSETHTCMMLNLFINYYLKTKLLLQFYLNH